MSYDFTLNSIIPASPDEIYSAWLDSRGHTEMTGGKAQATNVVGGEFTAWDGYISGKNLELVPGKEIVQSWRTTQFTAQDPDSQIIVMLEPLGNSTQVTLHHNNVPDGHTSYERSGWEDHYFAPMKRYFEKKRSMEDA